MQEHPMWSASTRTTQSWMNPAFCFHKCFTKAFSQIRKIVAKLSKLQSNQFALLKGWKVKGICSHFWQWSTPMIKINDLDIYLTKEVPNFWKIQILFWKCQLFRIYLLGESFKFMKFWKNLLWIIIKSLLLLDFQE